MGPDHVLRFASPDQMSLAEAGVTLYCMVLQSSLPQGESHTHAPAVHSPFRLQSMSVLQLSAPAIAVSSRALLSMVAG
jgi:hypothetical protein